MDIAKAYLLFQTDFLQKRSNLLKLIIIRLEKLSSMQKNKQMYNG